MSEPLLFKSIGHVKSVSDAGVVTAVVSTSAIDRDQEIVLSAAFLDLIDIYKSNPLLAWAHPWQFDEIPDPSVALGHALDIRIVPDNDGGGGYVEMDFTYDANENPVAAQVLGSVRKGTIRAYSVGFFSRASVTARSSQAEIDALPRFAREALLSGRALRVHTKVELFEVSQVLIGSNREALAALRSFRIKTKEADMAENSKEPVAKVGHAPTNDIRHRLMGALESLCSSYFGGEENEEPPEPEVCYGVIRVLQQVIADLQVLAGADDDDTALAPPVASDAPQGVAKAGRRLSAKSLEALQKAIEHHENGMKCLKSLLEDDFAEDDGSDLDGEREGEDSLEEEVEKTIERILRDNIK